MHHWSRCELTAVCVCYRGMTSQITAHEEQMAEYTDRIAAMEEELKKVRRRSLVTVTHENLHMRVNVT